MNIKTLAYTCICALFTALPLAARAEGDAGDVTYATVWEQRKNWRKFNSEQLILYTEILIEKAQTRAPDDNSADLSSVIGRLAYNCSEEQLRELDEKLCTFEIGNAVNFYPAFPKTADHYIEMHPEKFDEAKSRYIRSKPSLGYSYDIFSKNCTQDIKAQLYLYNYEAVSEYCIFSFNTIQWTLSQGVGKYVAEHGGVDEYMKKKINPYVELSEKLRKVQNSRKLEGMAELYRDYGGVEWIDPVWPTEKEINQFMEDCFAGKVDLVFKMHGSHKCCKELNILKLYLGTDEYNEFVRRYNIHASGAFARDTAKTPATLTPFWFCDIRECPHKRWAHNFEFASRAAFAYNARNEARKAGDKAKEKEYNDLITWSVLQDLRTGTAWVDDPELFD